jgi:hypothetical protein
MNMKQLVDPNSVSEEISYVKFSIVYEVCDFHGVNMQIALDLRFLWP